MKTPNVGCTVSMVSKIVHVLNYYMQLLYSCPLSLMIGEVKMGLGNSEFHIFYVANLNAGDQSAIIL